MYKRKVQITYSKLENLWWGKGMKRYCNHCKQNYEFKIKSMEDLNHLICPVCGCQIHKDSKAVGEDAKEYAQATEKTEAAIGNIIMKIARFNYVFFLLMGMIGVFLYLLHLTNVMYVFTIVTVLLFLIDGFRGAVSALLNVGLTVISGFAGYYFLQNIEGICLGFFVMLFIRHLCKNILWRLFWRFLRTIRNL